MELWAILQVRSRTFHCAGLFIVSDIVLVRMTSDSMRPPEQRYGYSNAVTGLFSLAKEEGIRGLARGLGTNTVRRSCQCSPVLTVLQARAVLMNVR